MDKDLSKQLLARAGIPTPPWITCRLAEGHEAVAGKIEAEIGYPCVIKPCSCGSSVGVSLVHHHEELLAALSAANAYEDTILAERLIRGRELTVSIMGNQVLPPVEIIPKEGFYDYYNKYQAGCTQEVCPAPLTEEEWQRLKELSLAAFRVLRLRGYARFDYIMDDHATPWCLEANTLPGMTPLSLLPLSAKAAGLDYDSLCEQMVLMAVENISKNY